MNKFELIKDNYPYYWVKFGETENLKTPILYIHGFRDHPKWIFEHANKIIDRDIYCVELPGHWETPLKDESQLKPLNMAKEILHLLNSLKVNKVILMGHSMGGGIAMMINYLDPTIVEKIILITPMNSHAIGLKQIYNFSFKFNNTKKSKNFYRLLVSERYVDELYNRTIKHLKSNISNRNSNYKTLSKNISSFENMKVLKQSEKSIVCKMLLILGDSDNIINSKKTEKYFKKRIPNSHIFILENVGHLPFYEEKVMFYQLINHFINDLL